MLWSLLPSDKLVNYFDSKAQSNWIQFIGIRMFTKKWPHRRRQWIIRLYKIPSRRPNKSISRTPPPQLFTRISSNDQRSDAETFLYCHSLDPKGRRRWQCRPAQSATLMMWRVVDVEREIKRDFLESESIFGRELWRAIRQKSRIHVPW